MVTLSKPISAGQAQAYHKEEFATPRRTTTPEASVCAASGRASLLRVWD